MAENCLTQLAHLFGSHDANRLTALRVLAPRNLSETGGSAPVLPSPFHPLFCEALLFLFLCLFLLPGCPWHSVCFALKSRWGPGGLSSPHGENSLSCWQRQQQLGPALHPALMEPTWLTDWLTDRRCVTSQPTAGQQDVPQCGNRTPCFFTQLCGGGTLNHDH